MSESCDIVIVGGGPVGAALALGLRTSGVHVVLLDARPTLAGGREDARSLALSYGSRLILERLGTWQALSTVTPIHNISVSQQCGFGRVELSATEARVPALGYVTGYEDLQRALTSVIERSGIEVVSGGKALTVSGDANSAKVTLSCNGLQQELTARLIAIADGGANLNLAHIKTRDYQQTALVCNLASEQPHRNRAFERFTPGGPLALLPTIDGWSLVWTASPEQAHELAELPAAEFCARLISQVGPAFGAFRLLSRRQVFPLVIKYATQPVAPRMILVGNAAQTLHPVAGQGLNLGLRDVWELARLIVARGTGDPGASVLLKAYYAQRRCDRTATILFTDSLIRLFSKDNPLLDPVRGIGLATLGSIAPAKNFLARRMMFGARG